MSTKRRSRASWQEKSKKEALQMMKELERRIQSGELVVTNCGFWSSGTGGNSTFRLDVKDRRNIPLLDQS